jgi:hypothetical protein
MLEVFSLEKPKLKRIFALQNQHILSCSVQYNSCTVHINKVLAVPHRLWGLGLLKEYHYSQYYSFRNAHCKIFLQVYSSKLYDSYKNWRECNGACVQRSVHNFCPPKEVCEEPNFVCNMQCLPASYRQWHQVWICILSTQVSSVWGSRWYQAKFCLLFFQWCLWGSHLSLQQQVSALTIVRKIIPPMLSGKILSALLLTMSARKPV